MIRWGALATCAVGLVLVIDSTLSSFAGFGVGYCLLLSISGLLLWQARPLTSTYRWILASLPVFGVAWLLSSVVSETVVGWVLVVAYALVLAGLVALIRRRVGLGVAALMLEALVLVGALAMTTMHLWWLSSGQPPVGFVVLDMVAVMVGFALLASTLARNADREHRLMVTAGIVAVFVEVVETYQVVRDAIGDQLAVLSAAPFLLVALAARLSRPGMSDAPAVGLRRTFGARQIAVAAVALLVPPALAVHLLYLDEMERATWMLGISAFLVVASGIRVWLLIRHRDVSFKMEQSLRHLGEELVKAEGDAVPSIAATHLTEAVGDVVTLLQVQHDGTFEVVAGDRSASGLPIEQRSLHGDVIWEGGLAALDTARVPTDRQTFVYATRSMGTESRLAVVLARHAPLTSIQDQHIRATMAQLGLAWKIAHLRELRHRERADARFRALVQDSRDIVMVMDASHEVSMVSPAVHSVLGQSEERFLGCCPLVDVHPDDREPARRIGLVDEAPVSGGTADLRMRHREGYYLWFRMSARDLRDDPEIGGVLLSFADIHAAKTAELQLRRAEARHRAMVDASGEVTALITEDLHISYVSRQAKKLLGYPIESLVGTSIQGILTEESSLIVDAISSADLIDHRRIEVELEVVTQWGERRLCRVTVQRVQVAENEEYVVALSDLTVQRGLQNQLRELSEHDEKSGLLNRSGFLEHLNSVINAEGVGAVGVVAIDIDDFRNINNALGHSAGDGLLRDVGGRLSSELRGSDHACRLGGDNFAVAISGVDEEEIRLAAHRLLDRFKRPFRMGNHHRLISASAGLAFSPGGLAPAALLQRAETALGRAQNAGASSFVEFDQSMQKASLDRFLVTAGLATALEKDQFRLVYQPIVAISSGRVTSVEALLRWDHPEIGFVSPANFIPLAEESGDITKMGRWVAETAAAQLVRWNEEIPGSEGLRVSINVSFRQIEVPQELDLLHALLTSELPADRFTLELTESVFLDNPERFAASLERIVASGTRVAIDDFGTGAAGFNHLRDLPFNVVKIDKSFIDGVGTGHDADQLVASIIDMAKKSGAETVAEGIENPTQLLRVGELGCDYGQGFFLSRPKSPEELTSLFLKGRDGSEPFLLAPAT